MACLPITVQFSSILSKLCSCLWQISDRSEKEWRRQVKKEKKYSAPLTNIYLVTFVYLELKTRYNGLFTPLYFSTQKSEREKVSKARGSTKPEVLSGAVLFLRLTIEEKYLRGNGGM